MTREDFDRILTEEGIDEQKLRDDLWRTRPSGDLPEEKLRKTAKKFKKELPKLRIRQELNRAMDREFNR